jgi:hypothetical protein
MTIVLAIIFWGSFILALSGAAAITPATELDENEASA